MNDATNNYICPMCGYELEIWWEPDDDEECPNCSVKLVDFEQISQVQTKP